MKRITALFIILTLITSCGTREKSDQPVIGVSLLNMANEYIVGMHSEMETCSH